MNPILKWVGSKRSVLSRIDPYLPGRCENYFEPFFGGGALYFKLVNEERLVKWGYLSDLNPDLILFYNMLRDAPDAVLSEYDALVDFNDRDVFYAVRDAYNAGGEDPAVRAARFLYINSCGFNGLFRVNKKGLCNVPYGGDGRKPRSGQEIREAVDLLRRKSNGPTLASVFEMPGPEPTFGDLVYCDPPYLGTFDSYTNRGWSEDDDFGLFAKCCEWRMNGAFVVVSTANPDLWREDFDVEPIFTSSKIKAKQRTEYVCYTGDLL